jgi:hypothetical protein
MKEKFIQQIEEQGESWENVSIGRIQISIKVEDYLDLIEQAKEMEKQQIIDCGNTCALMQYIHVDKVSQMSIEEVEKLAEEDNITFGEQYYNETFKSEQDNEQI